MFTLIAMCSYLGQAAALVLYLTKLWFHHCMFNHMLSYSFLNIVDTVNASVLGVSVIIWKSNSHLKTWWQLRCMAPLEIVSLPPNPHSCWLHTRSQPHVGSMQGTILMYSTRPYRRSHHSCCPMQCPTPMWATWIVLSSCRSHRQSHLHVGLTESPTLM